MNKILNIESDKIYEYLIDIYNKGELYFLLPEVCDLDYIKHIDGVSHKNNFYHTLRVVENIYNVSNNPNLRLVAFLHDIGKKDTFNYDETNKKVSFHNHENIGAEMLKPILKRLNIECDYEYIYKIVKYHGIPKELSHSNDSAIRRFIKDFDNNIEDLVTFCKCDITTSNNEKKQRQIAYYDRFLQRVYELKKCDEDNKWRCVITGEDIIKYFNVSGKDVGLIKNKIIEAIKGGIIPNEYEIAYEYMKKIQL